jgi:hypothetical protein
MISEGSAGVMMVLFSVKSPNDVIFVKLEFVVLQGSSFTQIVVVQFPF